MTNDFEELIEHVNKIENLERLGHGRALLSVMSRVISLRNEADKLEEDLVTEDRMEFFMLACSLKEEEVLEATKTIKGRIRHLNEMKEKQEVLDEIDKKDKE